MEAMIWIGLIILFVVVEIATVGLTSIWFAGGALISLISEVCQLVFHRGLFEWDDMIHNALGCMIGCGIANVIRWGIGRKNTRRGR